MAFSHEHGPGLRRHIEGHLSRFERRASNSELRRAAVAIALLPGEGGESSFVLTRRTATLRNHGGQFALPGGRVDAGEAPTMAALRELAEEVGLESEPANVLGCLDDYETRSGFAITPVVVWLSRSQRIVVNPLEVAWSAPVPLRELSRDDVPYLRRIPETDRLLIGMPMAGTVVHAPTAAILYQLREVGLFGRSTRVDGFEEPVFAWR